MARTPVPWRALVAVVVIVVALCTALWEGRAAERTSAPPGTRSGHSLLNALSSLPLTARGPVSEALGTSDPAYRLSSYAGGFRAVSPAQDLHLRFDRTGVALSSGTTDVGLSLRAIGYGGSASRVAEVAPLVHANRVRYPYAAVGLTGWYVNGPLGLEQGFTLQRPPPGHPAGPLTLSMVLSGNVHASLASHGQSILLSGADRFVLRYGGLSATDARGHTLHSWLQLRPGRILIHVDTRAARYPVRIDPLIQPGEKIIGTEETEGTYGASFGYSVALSADGNTALIGGPEDNTNEENGAEGSVGAAWVFTRSGSTWTQQGPKLLADGETGHGRFGYSVALSANGNTALIGGYQDDDYEGAAWVFTRSGSTWTQQGSKLTGAEEIGEGHGRGGCFGESVALSGDGNTALIGGACDSDKGAAWVFTRSESTWTQQGPKLTDPGHATSGVFGWSIALSGDGNTALIGDPIESEGTEGTERGAAWVFTRSGSTWTQQGERLTGGGEIGEGEFGWSVALSADSNTALIGGPYNDGQVGATWVFTRSGSTWTQQGEKLTASGESGTGFFGSSEALSANGNIALIGASQEGWSGVDVPSMVGSAWEFKRSGTTWSQQGEKLTGSDEVGHSFFGESVALSESGRTAVIGGPYDHKSTGAVWAFVTVPTVTTDAASATGQTSATLNAEVDPNGEEVSSCYFEYGTATDYTASTPCTSLPGSGEETVLVSAPVTNLRANTTYHFRIVTTAPNGTSHGTDETLTTQPSPPSAATDLASSASQTSATLNGDVNPNGGEVADCHFEYGTSSSYTTSVPCASLPGSGESPVGVSATAVGLTANTVYHFRIVATNTSGTSYGADETLTTIPNPPTVATAGASSLGQTTATLNATVNPNGGNIKDCHFEYGTTVYYGSRVPCSEPPGSGESPVDVAEPVTGLVVDTTYHFRIVAANASGTTYGSDEAFTTLPYPPTVVTGAASAITLTSATLNATVDPNGGTVDDCHFDYGTTTAYGSSVPCTTSPGSGVGALPVSAPIEHLDIGATYYFRIVASSAGGTSDGADQVLTAIPDAELASASLIATSSGTVTVSLTCDAGGSSCKGTVTLSTAEPVGTTARYRQPEKRLRAILTLAVGSFKDVGARGRNVKLHMLPAGRKLLSHAEVLHARATIVAHDRAGASHTTRNAVTIRAAKAPRRGKT